MSDVSALMRNSHKLLVITGILFILSIAIVILRFYNQPIFVSLGYGKEQPMSTIMQELQNAGFTVEMTSPRYIIDIDASERAQSLVHLADKGLIPSEASIHFESRGYDITPGPGIAEERMSDERLIASDLRRIISVIPGVNSVAIIPPVESESFSDTSVAVIVIVRDQDSAPSDEYLTRVGSNLALEAFPMATSIRISIN